MELVISPCGNVRAIYDEILDLTVIGPLTIRRASYVEPDERGRWFADLAPVDGPNLGPFVLRSQALAAEQDWLAEHILDLGQRPATAAVKTVGL